MKKLLPVVTMVAMAAAAIAIFAFRGGESRGADESDGYSNDRVDVFYFNLTRRCVT